MFHCNLIKYNIIKIMSHASMGGSYFTQFDYIYETDDMIELTFDQLNQAYGSNFNQKVFGNKIRSNFTSQGNMNYFNNNQNLTVAFTFKTQKPDTICHLTTVGTILELRMVTKIGVIYGLDMFQYTII